MSDRFEPFLLSNLTVAFHCQVRETELKNDKQELVVRKVAKITYIVRKGLVFVVDIKFDATGRIVTVVGWRRVTM